MAQRLAYPVNLERQNDGSILVSFPDIPEALTEGATEEGHWQRPKTLSSPLLADTSRPVAPSRGHQRVADERLFHFRLWLPPGRPSTAQCACKASATLRSPGDWGSAKARSAVSSAPTTVRIWTRWSRRCMRSDSGLSSRHEPHGQADAASRLPTLARRCCIEVLERSRESSLRAPKSLNFDDRARRPRFGRSTR